MRSKLNLPHRCINLINFCPPAKLHKCNITHRHSVSMATQPPRFHSPPKETNGAIYEKLFLKLSCHFNLKTINSKPNKTICGFFKAQREEMEVSGSTMERLKMQFSVPACRTKRGDTCTDHFHYSQHARSTSRESFLHRPAANGILYSKAIIA